MKHIIILAIAISAAATSFAQPKFPFDSISHVVAYDQSFRLSSKVKSEDVYAAAISWFGDAAKFSRRNAMAPLDTVTTRKNKKKAEAEEQFDNPRPLQMQDPAGGKVQGMGIIRYYGTSNSIKLLYIKYDIAVRIKADAATVSISNIHYFHYNAGSYKQIPLYNFIGGTPCEEVGTVESLIGCENFHEEFKNLALYCNKEIYSQIGDFKKLLGQKKYLYDARAATATPAKPVAKTVAKKK